MKTIAMPKLGDTMEEGKILRWIKKEGDSIKRGEPLAEVETEKVNIEIESFFSGVLRKILVPEGTSAAVGSGIALVGTPDEGLPDTIIGNKSIASTVEARQAAPAPAPSDRANQERIFISPVARRLADEHHVDYTNLQGSGPNKRIIKMDIEAALASQPSAPIAPVLPTRLDSLPLETHAEPIAAGDVEIPLTTMRRTIARRLAQSMQTAPHFYVTSVIDTGKLALLRQQINEYAAQDPSPVKISFNDLILRAVAQTLVRMPEVNVSFAEDRLIQRKQVHIGVAVALEQGLIVPVVHNADQRSMLALAHETRRLAEAARTGKLRPEDLSGGTFTVSNLGMFDVDSFTAIINPPESAILAVGSITSTPVVIDGQVVIRDRMKVTLSSDHRAIDGAIAARFLQAVKRLLEEPFGLLL